MRQAPSELPNVGIAALVALATYTVSKFNTRKRTTKVPSWTCPEGMPSQLIPEFPQRKSLWARMHMRPKVWFAAKEWGKRPSKSSCHTSPNLNQNDAEPWRNATDVPSLDTSSISSLSWGLPKDQFSAIKPTWCKRLKLWKDFYSYWPIGRCFFLGFPLNFRDRVVPQDGSGWTILHGSKFRTAKLHGQGAYTCERTRPFTRGNSDAGSWVEVLRKVRWNQQPLKLSWLRKQMIWGIPFFEHVPMWRTEPTLPSCFAIGRSGGIIHSNMADMWQLALYTLW